MSDKKMKTVNFSYIWVNKVEMNECDNLDIHLTGERGTADANTVKERVNIVIRNCCGIGGLVAAVMEAHDKEVDRVVSDRQWQRDKIAEHVTEEES